MDFFECVELCDLDQTPNLIVNHPQIPLEISILLFCILHIVGPLSVSFSLTPIVIDFASRVFWLAPHFTQMVEHKDTCCSDSVNPYCSCESTVNPVFKT